ncbi:MAG: GTPase [Sulfolobales archaeon]
MNGSYKESLCFSRYLRTINIQDLEYLRNRVLSRYLERVSISTRVRDPIVRAREIYSKKILRCLNEVLNFVSLCEKMPLTSHMPIFYSELIRSIYDDQYDNFLRECRTVSALVKKIYKDYKRRIFETDNVEDLKRLSREFVGRIISIVKRRLRNIDLVKNIVIELSKMPCLEENIPKIVLTGMPQVGKSTFLSVVSRAKPEISNYPFTTKSIIIGHYIDEKRNIRVMILDTPGILDRPVSDMNPIELKAIYSLKYLADAIIFLIDPRKNFYYTIDQQLKTLEFVQTIIGDRKIYVAINKIDIASEEEIKEIVERLKDVGFKKEEVSMISALKRIGVNELLNKIFQDLLKIR